MIGFSASLPAFSALSVALLLAGCATESMTGSGPSDAKSILDPTTKAVAVASGTTPKPDSDGAKPAVDSVAAAGTDTGAGQVQHALEGTWKRTLHSLEPGITLDGVLVTDLLMQDDISSRDNLTRFKAGGTWTEDEGLTKSVAQGVQSEDGAWSLNAAGDVLSLYPAGTPQGGEHFDFRIEELTAATLRLSAQSDGYSDHLPHTETLLFTRQ